LRLEAGMPLYGHELSETIDPFEAGLGFAVQLKGRTFPGCEPLRTAKKNPTKVRIGLSLEGKRVPREHYLILDGDTTVGEVSSGTFSPTLQRPIAMGFVAPAAARIGHELNVDIRGRMVPATVVELPFYQRA
jgi:aminomethyltransferase